MTREVKVRVSISEVMAITSSIEEGKFKGPVDMAAEVEEEDEEEDKAVEEEEGVALEGEGSLAEEVTPHTRGSGVAGRIAPGAPASPGLRKCSESGRAPGFCRPGRGWTFGNLWWWARGPPGEGASKLGEGRYGGPKGTGGGCTGVVGEGKEEGGEEGDRDLGEDGDAASPLTAAADDDDEKGAENAAIPRAGGGGDEDRDKGECCCDWWGSGGGGGGGGSCGAGNCSAWCKGRLVLLWLRELADTS